MSSSPTTKSGFMISRHGERENKKIRLYARMTQAGSDAGNTLKSGYPINAVTSASVKLHAPSCPGVLPSWLPYAPVSGPRAAPAVDVRADQPVPADAGQRVHRRGSAPAVRRAAVRGGGDRLFRRREFPVRRRHARRREVAVPPARRAPAPLQRARADHRPGLPAGTGLPAAAAVSPFAASRRRAYHCRRAAWRRTGDDDS